MVVRQLCDQKSLSKLDWSSSVVVVADVCNVAAVNKCFDCIQWCCVAMLDGACTCQVWLTDLTMLTDWLTGWLTRLSWLCKFAWRVFLRISLKAEIVGAQYPLICAHENEIHWHQMTFNAATWRGLKAALVLALWAVCRQRRRRVYRDARRGELQIIQWWRRRGGEFSTLARHRCRVERYARSIVVIVNLQTWWQRCAGNGLQ